MRFQAPRGTEDILPASSPAWRWVEREFLALTALYGYGEIRTPTFEERDLFIRTSGETSDVVSKEMYDFVDKGGRNMVLKPESTAPVMRALLEHNLCPQGTVTRLCYLSSPHFRYDRPQKGRLREHHQHGVELVGSRSATADAEVIEIGVRFLERIGLSGITVKINSIGRAECRARYRDAILGHATPYLADASEELKERVAKNPLRLLDMKDPAAQEAMVNAPSILDFLEPESTERFTELQRLLSAAGIAYEVAPDIVRGLDYYTETVFEAQSANLGAQSTVFAGGRYDDLIKEIGGPDLPSVGFGMGIERLLILLEDRTPANDGPQAFVAYSEVAQDAALQLARELRAGGVGTLMDLDAKSLKSQLRQADKAGVTYVAILGEEELAADTVSLKNLVTGEQRSVPRAAALEAVS
jgi:histidyl-tRNA synthetase